MLKDFKPHFSLVIKKLEKSIGEIVQAQGYNKKSERMKILSELIREQLQHENSHHTASKTR